MTEFADRGTPLTETGLDNASNIVEVGLPALWAVISVETSGCGFLSDRRPKILFERHLFSRLTDGKFDDDDSDVSNPTPGGYGPAGSHQYDRLNAAAQFDREAALKSASWGLGQILGQNFSAAGFDNVQDMVDAMVATEDAQLKAMASFIKSSNMSHPLAVQDWPGFARRYNGPNFAAHNYDGLLRDAFHRYSTGPLPDLRVRQIQVLLMYKGFSPGAIDGREGRHTDEAVAAFQRANGMGVTGRMDEALLAALLG